MPTSTHTGIVFIKKRSSEKKRRADKNATFYTQEFGKLSCSPFQNSHTLEKKFWASILLLFIAIVFRSTV
jgi:hypothetical protein